MRVAHHPHVEDLLGAYALDAIDPSERQEIEAHLADCPRCSQEVREHREMAAALSSGLQEAPADIWAAIEDEIAPPTQNVIPLRRRYNWAAGAVSVAAAIGLVLIAAVFVQSGRVDRLSDQVAAEQEQLSNLTAALSADPMAAAIQDAITAEGSIMLTMSATDAANSGDVRIVLTSDGTGFVLGDSLPRLRDNETYQLWAVTDGRVVSAGLFGPDMTDGTFRVDTEGLEALAITPEVAGGVVVSDNAAVALFAFNS